MTYRDPKDYPCPASARLDDGTEIRCTAIAGHGFLGGGSSEPSDSHMGRLSVTLPSGEPYEAAVMWTDAALVGEQPPLFDSIEDELQNEEELIGDWTRAKATAATDRERQECDEQIQAFTRRRDAIRARIAQGDTTHR